MTSADYIAFLIRLFGAAVLISVIIGLLTVFVFSYTSRRTMNSSSLRGLTQQQGLYAQKLSQLLNSSVTFPRGNPAKILDFLFLGSGGDAMNVDRLRANGINHVINCATGYISTGSKFYGKDFKYLGFRAEDEQGYNIMQHFEEAYQFIEHARKSGGKVLIHCIMGVNRSGALATAYVMCHENIGPISAARKVLGARKCILTNDDFQDQLIKFAADRNLLELDKEELSSSSNVKSACDNLDQ